MPAFIVADRIAFDKYYSLPRIFDTDAEYRRAHHLDLAEMSDLELLREEIRVRMALAGSGPRQAGVFLDPQNWMPAQEWLVQRLAAIRAERQKGMADGYGS